MEAVSECAVSVARRIVAAGALTVGIIELPAARRAARARRPARLAAFMQDLGAALYALTAVPSATWAATSAGDEQARAQSPLLDLAQAATATAEYLLCDLGGLQARGEHGAAAGTLHAVLVLAEIGCDDRALRDLVRELPRERMLGVVLMEAP
ncbi:MAG: hypothetical protein IPL79_19120 [Myxococcales bacterium]|nr:hypothetical protein [Myxococcales bacterium]